LASPKIVVIGSANTDMIVRVPRLPARGETVLGGQYSSAGGGKGANQAIAARRLGAEVTFVARIGRDSLGDATIIALEAEGLYTGYVARDYTVPSGVALILVEESGENVIAVAPGGNARLTTQDVESAISVILSSKVVIAQLEIPLEAVRSGLEIARRFGTTTMLNPAPVPDFGLPDDLYPLVDILNPNREEASKLSSIDIVDRYTAEMAGRIILSRGVGSVVLTLGSQGALIVTKDQVIEVPAYEVAAVDTVGAGDAFTAGLAVALASGGTLERAAKLATAAAALATTKPGAQPSLPTIAEVAAFIATHRPKESIWP
jgi:ribokinase